MKKMKILENGKILYKLDKEKVYERIADVGFKSELQFNKSIGRSKGYISDIFRRRDGYCKIELIEFLGKQLKVPDAEWLIEEEREESPKETPSNDLEEIKAELKEIKELIKSDNDLTINLKYKPFQKVYYTSPKTYALTEGIIVGYFISNKLNVTYKVEDIETKIKYDIKPKNLCVTLYDTPNKK